MGRKSKLKQLRRKSLDAVQSNSWIEDLNIITVDIDDNNWLFQYGNPFDSNAKTVHQGSLNSCIDLAYKKIHVFLQILDLEILFSEIGV
jgi:hypothetical protein